MTSRRIANPGAKLGQSIGVHMAKALDKRVLELCEEQNYRYLYSGVTVNGKTIKRLTLKDKYGEKYQVDGIIANLEMQPLAVFEYKYIRYAKHNNDKGSWICRTNSAIRSYYPSIRTFFAILAGNWTPASITKIKNSGVAVHVVHFDDIATILEGLDIPFRWEEDDRDTAVHAYRTYEDKPEEVKEEIGEMMIHDIRSDLLDAVREILDPQHASSFGKITMRYHSNLGEVVEVEFTDKTAAIEAIRDADASTIFSLESAPRVEF